MNSPRKPILFISYAHADEPERPGPEEIQWLTFVTGYLRPALAGAAHAVAPGLLRRKAPRNDGWGAADPSTKSRARPGARDAFALPLTFSGNLTKVSPGSVR
jgi:hypothetical protein